MAGLVVCFLVSFTLFVTLGLAFEARERRTAALRDRGAARVGAPEAPAVAVTESASVEPMRPAAVAPPARQTAG